MARPKPKLSKKAKDSNGKVKKSVVVDFSNVSEGFPRVPDGEYFVKVIKIESKESDSGNDYLLWSLEILDGKHAGKALRHTTSLQPQALFNLRNTLEAIGETVTKSKMKLSLKEYLERTLGVSVENESYQGRKQSRVVDVYEASSADDLKDEEEDDDEDEDDEDEDEEEEDEDTDDDDVDEDEESEDDEDDDDESEEEAEDDDADDEDEPEEEPVKEAAPAKAKKTSAKKGKSAKAGK